MKKVIFLVICFLLVTSMAHAGDAYYITAPDGVAKVAEKTPFNLAANPDRKGIDAAILQKLGYLVVYFIWQPGTTYEVHAGDTEWIGFTFSGSVKSTLGDKNLKVHSSHILKAGDITIWEPNTYHGWEVIGDEPWVSIWFHK